MWGTVRHHQLHHTDTYKHLYHVYLIHLTSLTSCNYILQTATVNHKLMQYTFVLAISQSELDGISSKLDQTLGNYNIHPSLKQYLLRYTSIV